MENNILLIALLSFAGGIFITWIFSRLYYTKKFIAITEFEQLQKELQALSTDKAVVDSELGIITKNLDKTTDDLKELQKEAESLKTSLTETATQKNSLQQIFGELKNQLQEEQSTAQQNLNELQRLEKEKSSLTAELRFAHEKLNTQKDEIENIGAKFENQFKVLAEGILDEKAKKFNDQQEKDLTAILTPLKDNIKSFKDQVETAYKTESDERISLREQIKQTIDLNKTLSQEAHNLTQALRGQAKHQGNWGEMILETILEYSGLQKNMQYFVQEHSLNEDGKGIQPDILVKYPDSRIIVIDSKVSLLHYERFCACETRDEQQVHLNLLVRSFKQHIDGLSSKNYQDITSALDFIMMFVPVEAGYITAMQADPELWQYAYKKRVLLMSPTNLIASMKLVNDLWQKDSINQNAQAIADKASKIYDKLFLFVEEFDKAGLHLERAQGAYAEARKKLNTGRGNLISQAEQMKKLKVAVKKDLPVSLVEQALLEDGIDTEDI